MSGVGLRFLDIRKHYLKTNLIFYQLSHFHMKNDKKLQIRNSFIFLINHFMRKQRIYFNTKNEEIFDEN